jgi:hypothetical protein
MPAPMSTTLVSACPPRVAGRLALTVVLGLAACSTAPSPVTSNAPSSSPSEAATPTLAPTPTPTPTPAPTPRFTNEPDPELEGLIPTTAGGATVVRAPIEEFGLTPGDIGIAYGDIGDRFSSLVVAYVEQPRATLYAMRVDGQPVATEDLEPHLATAGRYVGIAGLDRASWSAATLGGHRVWVRPEDGATAVGTMIYTWSSGEFVFLLIGVEDAVNRAIVASLPGEAPPSPTPAPSASGSASGKATASPGD